MSQWERDEVHGLAEVFPTIRPGSMCMNCGEHRLEVAENGGWCDSCEGRSPAPMTEERAAELRELADEAVEAFHNSPKGRAIWDGIYAWEAKHKSERAAWKAKGHHVSRRSRGLD